jgi:transcriptional regulator with XRE-family HTH domain
MRLTQLRIDAGFSTVDLAAKAGISYQQLLNIERGETTNPKVATLHKLAEALGGARPSELLMEALPPRHSEPATDAA